MSSLNFATEAQSIDDARDAAYAGLRAANERGLTGADVDVFSDAMDAVKERCETLRRTFYPHRHSLSVISGVAMTLSRTGRSAKIVWRRER